MKLEQLHHRLVTLSEQVAELHTVLVAEMPQDEEGLMIHDGSDLADALKCLTQLDFMPDPAGVQAGPRGGRVGACGR